MGLRIDIDYDRGVPVYRQIFEGVVAALEGGAIKPDERLPTIHELADTLEVNPNTVARAYRDLEQAGYVVAERGRGTFPAPQRPTPDRPSLLEAIAERAFAEAARYGIGRAELAAFLRGRK
jgi:GntR family transcriptional regulator